MASKITVELPHDVAQFVANFLASQTFESFAQFADNKSETYDLRDSANFLLRRLREHVTPHPHVIVARPQIPFIKIPARHISGSAQKQIAIRDIQRAILKGASLPGWAIADFDAGNVEIVDGPDVDIKPIPEF
jgi:hypothetical protein